MRYALIDYQHIREGATENATVVSALLGELVERGLDFSTPRLYILDGGKALHASCGDQVSVSKSTLVSPDWRMMLRSVPRWTGL